VKVLLVGDTAIDIGITKSNDIKGGFYLKSNRKDIMRVLIVPLFTILLILNVSFAYGYLRQYKYIENSFEYTINRANIEFSNAYQSLVYKLDNDNESLIRTLIVFQHEFENASKSMQSFVDYYNYKSKSAHTPLKMKIFFDSYISVSDLWVNAIITEDSNNIPTTEDVDVFVGDVKIIISKFSIYDGAEGNSEVDMINSSYDELMRLVDEIYSEIKSKKIKEYLEKRSFNNLE